MRGLAEAVGSRVDVDARFQAGTAASRKMVARKALP